MNDWGFSPNLPGVEARLPLELARPHGFVTTHWTTIRACAGNDAAGQLAREELCRIYWYPLYAYIKRLDHQSQDAADLTQDFFADILGRPWLKHADESRGKFRSFLLASLHNFLRDGEDRRKAKKRAGAYRHVPLDMGNAELRYSLSVATSIDPAEIYEVEWASAVVANALGRLRDEYVAAGKSKHYQHLECYLMVEGDAGCYEATATELGTTLANVKVLVHRLRKRYGALLREQVALTVATPEDVDDEVRYMRAVLVSAR